MPEREMMGSEEVVRRSDRAGGKLGCPAKESVHAAVDDTGAQAREARGRDCEIRHQPLGSGAGGADEFWDEALEFIRSKTIEEEMGHDEIKGGRRRVVVERVSVNEGGVRERQVERMQATFSETQHAFAGIHTGDVDARKLAAARHEEFSGAFAKNEDATGIRDLAEMFRAATLEFAARKEWFHPPIMRSNKIEAHSRRTSGVLRRQCHQQKAMAAPKV